MRRLQIVYALLMAALPASLLLLPLRLQEMGVQSPAELAAWTGWLYAAGVGVSAVVGPIWGHLADVRGVRWNLLRACGGLTLACLGFALSTSPIELLFMRAFQGAFSGVQPASYAVAAGLSQGPVGAKTYARLIVPGHLGRLIGPNLMLAGVSFLPLSSLFWGLGALCLGAALIGRGLPNIPPVLGLTRHKGTSISSFGAKGRAIFGVGIIASLCRGLVEQLLPVAVAATALPIPSQANWLAAVHSTERLTSLVTSRAMGKLVDNRGYEQCTALGLAALGAGAVGFALSQAPALMMVSAGVFGLGSALLHLSLVTGMTLQTLQARAAAVAWEASAARLGAMGGTLSMGLLVAALGCAGAFGFVSLVSITAAVLTPIGLGRLGALGGTREA